MATLDSVIAAKQANPEMGNRADGLYVTGNVTWAICEYTATGSEATNDVLRLVKLPDRAIVIPQLCSIRHEAMGSAFSIKIGDADDTSNDDRYSAALDLSSAGQTDFSAAAVGGLTPHVLEKQDGAWVQGVLTSVTTPTADKKMTVYIGYITQT